jgi:hypothetical protein
VILTIAVALALATIPQFAWIFTQAHAANKAFAVFSATLIAKDYERAYALTTPDFQSAISELDFTRQQTALRSDLGDLKKIIPDSYETQEHQEGWSSDISARFVFRKAERRFDFALKKQGAVWKVNGYRER